MLNDYEKTRSGHTPAALAVILISTKFNVAVAEVSLATGYSSLQEIPRHRGYLTGKNSANHIASGYLAEKRNRQEQQP